MKKMNSDVSKELLRKINKSFTLSYQKSEKVRKLLLAIKSKNCDYLKAMEYAEEVGRILAEAYMKNLSSDVLPDGKMYYDIASAILNPTLENNYGLISSYVCGAMDVMNEKAGINVKARKPSYNASKTLGLIKKVSEAEYFDDVKNYLNEPVITNALSIVDEGARTNADLHYSMGYKPVIVRRASFGCCKWCRGLAGTQEYYPTMNRDIFRRHQNCRCTVIYDPGNNDGKVQDVYSKEWKEKVKKDENKAIKTNYYINSRSSGKGNPSAILHFGMPLSKRQSSLLERLSEFDSYVVLRKKDVNMRDLSALTASTGCEFAMFTKGSTRIVIRGNKTMVNIDVDKAKRLYENGYRWSGHTHPGTDANCLIASEGDSNIVVAFGARTTVIYNSVGMYNVIGDD